MTKIPAPDIPIPIHLRKNKIPSTTSINASRKNFFPFFLNIFVGLFVDFYR